MSAWLDALRREAAARVENRPAYYSRGAQTKLRAKYADALTDRITEPIPGVRPARTSFLSLKEPAGGSIIPGTAAIRVDPFDATGGNYSSDTRPLPEYDFDQGTYIDAQFDWMRGQDRYEDWSDADIRTFVGETVDMSDAERASSELWEDSRIARDKAAEEAEADRNKMLADLETFKDQYNEAWIAETLGREKAYWDTKIEQTTNQVTTQYANMGRIASPYMMAELTRRMTAQAGDALQVRRFELENERRQHMQYVLEMQNQVFQNTERNVMDPATAATVSQMLGQGDSNVSAA